MDLPWAAATSFSPSSALKSLPPGEAKAVQFSKDNALGRPTKQSAEDLAAHWIGSTLDEETAQEYLTGEELPELEAVEEPGTQANGGGGASADVVQALQQRIFELERQVSTQQTGASALEAKPKAPALLNLPSTTPASIDWAKLHQLAGSPPPRVGKQEASRAQRPKSMAFDHVVADVEKEADEMQTGEEGLDLLAQDGDALSKVMMGQLRQNQLLLQKLLGPKFQDPVLGALSSSTGSDSASAASGVKGCLARDAFIRAMNDLQRVASVTQANAAKELGLSEEWQSHEEVRTQNPHRRQQDGGVHCLYGRSMDGRLGSRERATARCCESLDGGKMQLGWLLTGMAEPPFNLYANNRRRVGLQPFCRLCHASWVAANLSYVRDLDVLESKMLSMGKPSKAVQQQEEGEAEEVARPKRRVRPPKGKGKKGGEQEEKLLPEDAFVEQ